MAAEAGRGGRDPGHPPARRRPRAAALGTAACAVRLCAERGRPGRSRRRVAWKGTTNSGAPRAERRFSRDSPGLTPGLHFPPAFSTPEVAARDFRAAVWGSSGEERGAGVAVKAGSGRGARRRLGWT